MLTAGPRRAPLPRPTADGLGRADAQITICGIRSLEELQGFVKAWAKENLRAMVERLQQLQAPVDAEA